MDPRARPFPLSSQSTLNDTLSQGSGPYEKLSDDPEVRTRRRYIRLRFWKSTSERPWSQRLNPLKWSAVPEIPSSRTMCPEHDANVLSQIYFGWMSPLMATGYRRNLEPSDIWLVNPDRAMQKLSATFQATFQERRALKANRALLMALYNTFRRDFWMGGICLFISSLGQVFVPFTLRYLLSFIGEAYVASVENRSGPPLGKGLGIVFGIVIMQLVQSLSTNQFLYHGAMVGAQARGVLTTAVFEKSGTISSRAKKSGKGYSDGRIMNIVSTDVARIDLAAGMLHMMWAAPMTILACLVLLIVNITYSAVAGFSLLVLTIPALTVATKSLTARRKDISSISDSRLSLITEVLKSIRFVKYNALESSFLSTLKGFRRRETVLIAKLLTTRNAIYVISISTPVFAAMLSFIVYSVTGHALGVGRVFSSLALFNAIRIPLSLLPIVIGQMADATACLNRIEDFLSAEEHQENTSWDVRDSHGIRAENSTFTWEQAPDGDSAEGKSKNVPKSSEKVAEEIKMTALSPEPFAIKGLDLTVGRNELLAVIGTIGSGKTSLLSALSGEMRKISGELTMGSLDRAFCPQQAWIQNATVKDNILFGKSYYPQWYHTVKSSCCLDIDFQQLSCGDDTEIGERGATLSGGQRQRISLARAIYSGSDIVLLDDPLSALDTHVGKHVFEHAICGVLKNKCRVLATHQLSVLSRCDRILWLDNGRVKELDTFANLMARSDEFRTMMASTTKEDVSTEQKVSAVNLIEAENTNTTTTEVGGTKGRKLMKEESRGDGHVPWSVYKAYIASSGHLLLGLIPIILLFIAQGANAVMGLWLGFWTSNRFHLSHNNYIGIYVALAVSQAVLMFLFTASISNLASIASRRTLDRATEKVIRSPQSFHDTQPLGRITGRLSRDVDVVDNQLPDALRMFLYTMVLILTIITMLIYYLPFFAVAIVPILALFLFATSYFRVTARSLKRHESVLRSKLFARFSESLSGVPTIRAFGRQNVFVQIIREAVDDMNAAYYLTRASERWLAMRLDLVANAMVLSVGLLVVMKRNVLHPSIAGVLLAYLLSMINVIQLVVRQLAEVQTGMVSMERLHEYATMVEGEPDVASNDVVIQPSTRWPMTGKFVMRNVQMRYRPDLPLVLDGINMTVRGGEKIGIVGRTGAGKSSITQAFFRLVELSGGHIAIDDIDISQVSLKDLRSRISIITQDPTLFKGTIRSNLDPFDTYADLDLWTALRKSGLLSDAEKSISLDTHVEESGSGFSLGQRQLISLARALLHNRRLILCDEATAAVDQETDAMVQKVMAEEFKDKTVVTIAHRLKTIIAYDRVIVMEKGRIVEVGRPVKLWETGGVFAEMCRGNGIEKHDFVGALA